ncbi:MAG: addiction module protein [Pyrinomonadaceae bacterium]|nr:addiction module protein [Pyrinomonadaceae bacterium]MBP6212450.1 addiction module protein [Pyrinomonadaceae bacterium]
MTATTMELFSMAGALPIKERSLLVERLLESMHPTDKEIDELWKIEVERRIDDIESGKVKTIPGDEVFAKIRERYAK